MRDRIYKGESLEDRLGNAAEARRSQVEKMKAALAKRKEEAGQRSAKAGKSKKK